ncbi:NAD(P)H-binding protein [Anaeromyxobacter sp. Fw109-5]|uniref:NAD(P)H-binding protein n=1 Tax=Anaeromyxobacter sp. (strain Fw109-5) TaxID=404589 RepID=UPI000158A852|nr:NAD(P)H-binding protein [Anaeromyxobacter sp. Fw109-5]ABS27933.1 NmrA family protein [Anaeromyxobacter sp. Fw109-5]
MTGASERVLVLGATGTVGRRVASRLRDRGVAVAAASRAGAVRFDWSDASTWEAATAGCTRAFVMAPDGVAVEPAFLRAAVARGVGRLVLLSSRAIEAMADDRLLAAEAAVRSAGAEWTIVRADWFDQNFDEGVLRDAVLAGEVAIPVGDARQAFVDAEDVAAVAAHALVEDGHDGRTYGVSGPEALSFAEALAIVSRASGRTVRHLGTADDYLRVMTGLGLPRAQVLREVAAFEALRAQGDARVDDTVERVTGSSARPFRRWAEEAAAGGAWRAGR